MNNKIYLIIIAVMIVIFIVGGVIFWRQTIISQNKINELEQLVIVLQNKLNDSEKLASSFQKENDTPKNPVSTSPCEISENKRGCARSDFNLITPNGGETLCIGSIYLIKWKVPSDVGTVTITLRTNELFGQNYKLGTFPASNNETGTQNGAGEFLWEIKGMPESQVYEMWINAVYKGSSVNDVSDKMFSILSCKG